MHSRIIGVVYEIFRIHLADKPGMQERLQSSLFQNNRIKCKAAEGGAHRTTNPPEQVTGYLSAARA